MISGMCSRASFHTAATAAAIMARMPTALPSPCCGFGTGTCAGRSGFGAGTGTGTGTGTGSGMPAARPSSAALMSGRMSASRRSTVITPICGSSKVLSHTWSATYLPDCSWLLPAHR